MATIDDVYDLLVIVDGKIDTLQSDVTAMKAKTDLLSFTGNDVIATLDGEAVAVGAGSEVRLDSERFADFPESSY